jgi:hypothetical protein
LIQTGKVKVIARFVTAGSTGFVAQVEIAAVDFPEDRLPLELV